MVLLIVFASLHAVKAEESVSISKQQAWESYQAAKQQTWNNYQATRQRAWTEYQDARAKPWNSYQELRAKTWKLNQDAQAKAWSLYVSERTKAWTNYQAKTITKEVYEVDLSQAQRDYETKIKVAREKYSSIIDKVQQVYEINIKQLSDCYDAAIKQINESYDLAIKRLDAAYNANPLKASIKAIEVPTQALNQCLTSGIAGLGKAVDTSKAVEELTIAEQSSGYENLLASSEKTDASQMAATAVNADNGILNSIYSWLKTVLSALPDLVKLKQEGFSAPAQYPSGSGALEGMGIKIIESSPELTKVLIDLTAFQKSQIDDAVWECQNTPMKDVLYRVRGYIGLQVEVLRKLILDEAARQGVTCQP
jgi:hypothetical protein